MCLLLGEQALRRVEVGGEKREKRRQPQLVFYMQRAQEARDFVKRARHPVRANIRTSGNDRSRVWSHRNAYIWCFVWLHCLYNLAQAAWRDRLHFH